jgi:hypothetical protein
MEYHLKTWKWKTDGYNKLENWKYLQADIPRCKENLGCVINSLHFIGEIEERERAEQMVAKLHQEKKMMETNEIIQILYDNNALEKKHSYKIINKIINPGIINNVELLFYTCQEISKMIPIGYCTLAFFQRLDLSKLPLGQIESSGGHAVLIDSKGIFDSQQNKKYVSKNEIVSWFQEQNFMYVFFIYESDRTKRLRNETNIIIRKKKDSNKTKKIKISSNSPMNQSPMNQSPETEIK